MATDDRPAMRIEIEKNGPYHVFGDIPLVRKLQIVSEFGEPLTWAKGVTIPTESPYRLCRCGHSRNKPFCDDSHLDCDFDGTEVADPGLTVDRQDIIRGHHIVVKRDFSLCMSAGFCGNRFTNIGKMARSSADSNVRTQMIGMLEHCPSGSWTYTIEEGQPDIEVDLPKQISVLTEMTDEGPIPGPYWVTGFIPVYRSDGQPFETRNRVTLCNCSLSGNKPLCDGTHRERAKEIAEFNK